MNAHSLREIQQLVEAALARHGTAGHLQVEEKQIRLIGNGRAASFEIEHLLGKWSDLPFSERQRECGLIARDLSRQRHTFAAGPRPRSSRRPMGLVALVVLAAGGALAYVLLFNAEPLAEESVPHEDPVTRELAQAEREREARATRVCNATRTRIAQGGTVGPTDAEGWVVEVALLWTAAQPFARNSSDFVAAARGSSALHIVWTGAPELAELSGPSTRVDVHERSLPEGASPQFHELTLTLRGEYVLPYFRETERIKLIRFAHALAERQSPMLGALYARCATGTTHHMGSWFLGTSPGAAASSLLYYMAAHALPPLLPHDLLSTREDEALEPAFALDTLLERTRSLKRPDLASGVGAQDGMVAGPPHFTTLGFPFVDSDRALRASYALTRMLSRPAEASR